MTFTLTEMLLFIIAGTLMVVAGLLIWLAVRVSKVSGEIEEVRPELRRLMRSSEEVLADVRKTVGRIDGIAETVELGTALARQALAPSLTRFGALVSGVKRGLRVLLGGSAFHQGNGAMVHKEE